MTPQERQLVDELFDRLAKLEEAPRDPDAERAIADGLRQAPHAVYALVQTTLVQDEALKRANAHILELEGGGGEPQEPPRGFLDNMRDTLFGREERRGSVPTVRPGGQGASGVWGSGQGAPPPGPGYGSPPPGPGYGSYGAGPAPVGTGGGSFLGTAASAAAGAIGGAMLLNGIRSMFGQSHAGGAAAYNPSPSTGSPWGGGGAGSASNSDLARQAGIDDIGTSRSASRDDDSSRSGLFGGGNDDQDDPTMAYDDSNDDDDMDVAGDFDDGDTDPTA